MKLDQIARISLLSLARFRLRAFLMMLSVFIGIATLTAIIAIGKGAQYKIIQGIKSFGPNSVMIAAGGGRNFGPPDDNTATLTLDDAKAIKESIKGVKFVAPFMTNFGQTIIYGNKNMTAQVVGATELWAEAWKWPLADGEFLSEDDTSTLSKNCVIGQTIVKELFGDQSPVGETIRINDVNLKIIGVLGPRGSSPHGLDLDRRVVVPLSTAMKRLNNVNYIGNIRVYAEDPPLSRLYDDDPTRLRSITASIAELLRERHHITPPGEDDFRITDSISVAETVENVSGTMAKFLALLSLITLVVGGVVIANIMFVSVNERKQEIGIRRAFGARENDILSQFLAEVVVVTLLGGLIGAIAGFFIAEGISKAYDLPAIFSWEPLVIAVIASLVVGFTSGILPARKAAMLDPVTAIRG